MCEKGAREDDGDLRQVSTFETDANIRTIITELNDSRLLVRIVGGDLIAIGAKYQAKGALVGILQGSSRTVRRQEHFLSFQRRNA